MFDWLKLELKLSVFRAKLAPQGGHLEKQQDNV